MCSAVCYICHAVALMTATCQCAVFGVIGMIGIMIVEMLLFIIRMDGIETAVHGQRQAGARDKSGHRINKTRHENRL